MKRLFSLLLLCLATTGACQAIPAALKQQLAQAAAPVKKAQTQKPLVAYLGIARNEDTEENAWRLIAVRAALLTATVRNRESMTVISECLGDLFSACLEAKIPLEKMVVFAGEVEAQDIADEPHFKMHINHDFIVIRGALSPNDVDAPAWEWISELKEQIATSTDGQEQAQASFVLLLAIFGMSK